MSLEEHHADQEFTIEQMASRLAMSVRQLQRKLKALTDQQPTSPVASGRSTAVHPLSTSPGRGKQVLPESLSSRICEISSVLLIVFIDACTPNAVQWRGEI